MCNHPECSEQEYPTVKFTDSFDPKPYVIEPDLSKVFNTIDFPHDKNEMEWISILENQHNPPPIYEQILNELKEIKEMLKGRSCEDIC